MTEDRLVSVAQFSDPTLARITQQMLIANGIEAEVIGEVSSYPCFNNASLVKVVVNPQDKEMAEQLISSDAEPDQE